MTQTPATESPGPRRGVWTLMFAIIGAFIGLPVLLCASGVVAVHVFGLDGWPPPPPPELAPSLAPPNSGPWPAYDLAMEPGQTMVVSTNRDHVVVEATDILTRRVVFNGHDTEFKLHPRRNPWILSPTGTEPAVARYGAYEPQGRAPGGGHAVFDEATVFCESSAVVGELLAVAGPRGWVWNNEGYLVAIHTSSPGNALCLSVNIFRLVVDGATLDALPPCPNGTIEVHE